jgi:hypothetical protein
MRHDVINGWWTARTRKLNAAGYYTKSMQTTNKATAECLTSAPMEQICGIE